MQRCSCTHLGQCPFQQRQAFALSFPDGKPMFRPLTENEDPKVTQTGDVVFSDYPLDDPRAAESVRAVARALDPKRLESYIAVRAQRECRAGDPMWKKMHPFRFSGEHLDRELAAGRVQRVSAEHPEAMPLPTGQGTE